MAVGDWAPKTTIRPTQVNIVFNDAGGIDHIGVGYLVVLPSGQVVASRGYTWHGSGDPVTGRQAPPEVVAELGSVMDLVLTDAAAAEGVDGVSFTTPPKPQHGPKG